MINKLADMEVDKVAKKAADMVADMMADKKNGRQKMADMELDKVVDMEVDKVADMVADIKADKKNWPTWSRIWYASFRLCEFIRWRIPLNFEFGPGTLFLMA